MSYSQFTLTSVRQAFGLNIIESDRFTPEPNGISASPMLIEFLGQSLNTTVGGSEKIKSEAIIYPVLLDLRRLLNNKINLFSGEDFTIDRSIGLNGTCDFLISRSTTTLIIENPVLAIVEAKKGDISMGLGQCVAEMIAAQRFNRNAGLVHGIVTSGTEWQFLKIEGSNVTIDLNYYPLLPVDRIMGMLYEICKA